MIVNDKQVFQRSYFCFYGPSKTLLLHILLFRFYSFLTSFAKNPMKKPSDYVTYIKSSYKLLLSCKDLRSRNFWQRNDGPLKIFENLHGKDILSAAFCKFSNNEGFLLTGMQNLDYKFTSNLKKGYKRS